MKIINIHTRKITQPKYKIVNLFKTLATKNDLMLATDRWPAMVLNNGLEIGSKGGHGPIRYFVKDYKSGEYIKFEFTSPKGFNGFHQFEIIEIEKDLTEIKHIIDMTTKNLATILWSIAIKWLHDAYIEDAFDKVENHFLREKKISEWSIWVKILRKIQKPKNR